MSHLREGFLWWAPPAAKSPDYSTPEAITLRAQEAAWAGGCPAGSGCQKCRWPAHIKALRTLKDAVKSDGKVYRDFQAALRRLPAT